MRRTPADRRWSPRLVLAVAFAVVVLIVAPVALVVSGGETETAPSTASTPITAPPVTAPPTAIPDVGSIDLVGTPMEGVEGFELAVGGEALLAAALVPDPDRWDNRVWRSIDGGRSWREVLATTDEGILVDVAGTGAELAVLISGHVVDGPSVLYRSTDAGDTWRRLELPLPAGAVGASATSVAIGPSTVVAGGAWQDVVTESFEGGSVQADVQVGLTAHSWIVEDGAARSAEVAPDAHISDLVWSGSTFVAVGLVTMPSERAAIWTSPGGAAWATAVLPDLPDEMLAEGLESAAVAGDGTVIALADTIGTERDAAVYRSAAGGAWELRIVEGLKFVNAAGAPWGFLAEANRTSLVVSPDGFEWSVVESITARLHSVVVADSRIYGSGFASGVDGAAVWAITTDDSG